jgi:DNA ligase-associated metallophosphoesterase
MLDVGRWKFDVQIHTLEQSVPASVSINFAGETLQLLADRAVHWPERKTLIVADVHLGKDASFRAAGLAVPAGNSAKDLARISLLLADTAAQRLVILGDLIHSRASHQMELTETFMRWRAEHGQLEVLLVRGNHDRRAGGLPVDWRVREVAEPHDDGPFVLSHEPRDVPKPVLCGHVHPTIGVRDYDGSYATLCCFVVDDRQLILPAFGSFTGGFKLRHEVGRRIYAVAGKSVILLGGWRGWGH